MATAKTTKTTKSKSKSAPKSAQGPNGPTNGKASVSPVARELAKDEKLLWESRAGGLAYALAHIRAVMMGMVLIVIAISWSAYVTRTHMMAEIGYVAWLFAALGVFYMAVPILSYIKARWFLFYGLTDKRLLIVQLFPRHAVRDFPIKALKRAVATGVNVGNGNLVIDAPGAVSKNPLKAHAGFYGVKYVTKLEEAVFALQHPEEALQRAKAKNKPPQAPSGGKAGSAPFTPSNSARVATRKNV